MRKILTSILLAFSLIGCQKSITFTEEQLLDKIKGGWMGQTIGVCYGGPTEFRYRSRMIPDSIELGFSESLIKWYFKNSPYLFDDLYMDLTFVNVYEEKGLNADINEFAHAFAYAPYPLWHANQAARANIIHLGMSAPESGHWRNNSHCSDIDFQIEADYAGLMAPAMVNAATHYTDAPGHIMNYGDGWYGGVYMASMYSLAFQSDDLHYVINEALKTIPAQSDYYKCMTDIINWHKENPTDWKACWQKAEEKWGHITHCFDRNMDHYNIDAKINSAYVLIGLLYGDKDFKKSIDIATRCGQDSDCNPASVGGILGTMMGYSNIPADWLAAAQTCEDNVFNFTEYSLNDTYKLSLKHAKEVIKLNGGSVSDDKIVIKTQKPVAVRYEKCYEGLKRSENVEVNQILTSEMEVEFEGVGVIARHSRPKPKDREYIAEVDIYLDGELERSIPMPYNRRRWEDSFFMKFDLAEGKHTLKFVIKNPDKDYPLQIDNLWVFEKE